MPPLRKARRVLLLLLLAALLGVGGAGAYCWWLSRQLPAWWRQLQPDEPTLARAESVENTVVSELSRVRPAATPSARTPYRSGEWTLAIPQDAANAWLATRVRAWVENRGGQWPRAVDGVQVSFTPGQISVGVHLVQKRLDRVVTVTGMPEVRDGAVWLRVDTMTLGGLPLPRQWILDQFSATVRGGSADDVLAALEGRAPVLDKPVIELDGGRIVRITAIRAEAGRLVLTCRTEKD